MPEPTREAIDSFIARWQSSGGHERGTGHQLLLEKLRRGEALTDKERKIHDHGLVTILKQIHDDLDAAVLEAYDWSDLVLEGGTGVPPVSSSGSHRHPACFFIRLSQARRLCPIPFSRPPRRWRP